MAHKSKQAASNPRKTAELLDSFCTIAQIINNARLDFDKQLNAILKVILDYLDVEQGSIMMRQGKNSLVVRAASRPELIGHRQTMDNGSVSAWVATHKKPLYIPDISKDRRFANKYETNYKKNSLLSVPILHDDKLVGIINVTDKIGAHDIPKEDISRLLDFASVLLSLLVQKDLQEKIRRQRNTLRKRNQELKKQQRLRTELTRMLVHDLKGPLSEVVANLDILSYSIPEEQREYLEAALVGCNKVERMVTNLTTIDKIEDGRLTPILEPVAPAELINETMSGMKGLAKIKQIALVPEVSEPPPPPVTLDRVLILRVLQNLLTNALGYSPAGTSVRFGCRVLPGEKQVEFFVHDQGPGIPKERQESIFEKYSRISDRQDNLVGTGLGLYFCKLAVGLHRGAIGVESSPGQGSRFWFHLPA